MKGEILLVKEGVIESPPFLYAKKLYIVIRNTITAYRNNRGFESHFQSTFIRENSAGLHYVTQGSFPRHHIFTNCLTFSEPTIVFKQNGTYYVRTQNL